MKLNDLSGQPIHSVDSEQIREALKKVYEGKLEAVILEAEEYGPGHFLQVPRGGYHLEYREGEGSPIYAAEGVELPTCQQVFLDYARGRQTWKTSLDWFPYPDRRKKPLGKTSRRAQDRWDPKQVILTGLLGTGCVGIFCLLSTILTLTETLIIGFAGLAGLVNAGLFHRKERLKYDLAPSLLRTGGYLLLWTGLTGLGLLLSVSQSGLISLSTSAVLLAGGYSIYLAGRRTAGSWRFQRESVEVEADSAQLVMVDNVPDAPAHPELAYHYLGCFRGQRSSSGIRFRSKKISRAIDSGRFHVYLRYLPEDPEVHRFSRWVIDPF